MKTLYLWSVIEADPAKKREVFDELWRRRDGGCAVCGRRGLPLVIDHDHKTGVVRDLLCNSCNLGLGAFGDSPYLLQEASEFLRRHAHERKTKHTGRTGRQVWLAARKTK